MVAADLGFSESDVSKIMLAVDEALANVIRHGYGGPCDKPIDICIESVDHPQPALRIAVRDFGRQIDPDAIAGRDLDDVRPGGLGVHIMRTVMDHVQYTCAPGGGMQLEMLKRLPA